MSSIAGQKIRVSRLNALSNMTTFQNLGGCSVSTTSATYVDITGASTTFTKYMSGTDSDIIVAVGASGFTTGASAGFVIGVNINSTDMDATYMVVSTTNVHTTLPAGWARFTGLAAGSYTVKLRAKRNTGAGTLTMDSGDSALMLIQERVL